MKLYIWQGEDVIPDYTGGMAGAMASSVEEAAQMVRDKFTVDGFNPEYTCVFLIREPDIISDGPIGFYQWGSA